MSMTICIKYLEGVKHYLDVAEICFSVRNLIIKDTKNIKKFPESLSPSPHTIKWYVLHQQLAKTKHVSEQRELL